MTDQVITGDTAKIKEVQDDNWQRGKCLHLGFGVRGYVVAGYVDADYQEGG